MLRDWLFPLWSQGIFSGGQALVKKPWQLTAAWLRWMVRERGQELGPRGQHLAFYLAAQCINLAVDIVWKISCLYKLLYTTFHLPSLRWESPSALKVLSFCHPLLPSSLPGSSLKNGHLSESECKRAPWIVKQWKWVWRSLFLVQFKRLHFSVMALV